MRYKSLYISVVNIICLSGVFVASTLLSGCASESIKNAGIRKSDIYIKETNQTGGKLDPAKNKINEGVVIDNGVLKVYAKGKSFLSVLDDVASIRRFNYIIHPDELSNIYINFPEDVDQTRQINEERESFDSIEDFISKSIQRAKKQYKYLPDNDQLKWVAASLDYRQSGNGFEIYRYKNKYEKSEEYRKIFLQNLSVAEAYFYISKLMNIPYDSYSPVKSVELPRRDSSPIQSIGAPNNFQFGNMQNMQSIQSIQSMQNNTSIETETDGRKLENKFKLISIPQQNALVAIGVKNDLDRISEIVSVLDSSYRQIIIEGKIFQYSALTSRKIGIALSSLNGQLDIKQSIGNDSFISVSQLFGSGVANSLPLNILNMSPVERRFTLLSSIVAHATDGIVRVTAEPRILLKPGQVSTLDITTTKLVQPTPSTTNSAALNSYNAIQPVQVEAGVFFTVKPTILSNNKIQLDLFLKHSEFSSASEKNVLMTVSQNQLTTSIVANSGELISLGGQETKKYSLGDSGIPTLKDISVVGHAFGLSEEEAANTQVEFMIKPIIDDIAIELQAPIQSMNSINNRINDLVKGRLRYLEIKEGDQEN